jgi:Tol biopolymer transport system component
MSAPRTISTVVLALLAAALIAGPAHAAPATRLVSKTSGGTPANDDSFRASISSSGRYVAFHSIATNLPGNDSVQDVLVHDRETGRTRLVSKTSGGTPANGHSFQPSISSSGRYVAFYSDATNLPGNDSVLDVFVHDRETGRTRLVSKTSGGTPANGASSQPSISSSGRYVAFVSSATNLPGNSAADVLVHDRKTGRTRLVSKTSGGTPANAQSFDPSISSSGRYVAFNSIAANLPGDDSVFDVFVHDRETGRTRLVSKTSGGTPANGHSFRPSISSSGRYVAFDSDATNLPGNDSVFDVFVHGPLS